MQLRLSIAIATLAVFTISGCSTISTKLAVNNGSLDYKKATTVESLKYPEGITARPATPLYPAPIIDPLALKNAPDFENQKGNRFAMPRPGEVVKNRSNSRQETYVRPAVLFDAKQNPLLKVTGKSDTIWQYTLATLSSFNYNVVEQSNTRYEATIKVDDKLYVLKLSVAGKNCTLVLFNPDNSYADPAAATVLLQQIAQNWPA
ncbi:hypothetical protein GCM10027155_16220 [Acinetobacter apis]|uniref:Beta-barrel assembly machine subunit BamC n=1 Tax=Acinetobacter apis TaxID=1229165 RepID=A0A217EGN3_9GAMM|nr:lipoprotein-34 precursor (NlpB) [Acinetobacter apis]SNQ29638.1 hypothetical protein SAMN05444584_1599 [Acinetobacter apis]